MRVPSFLFVLLEVGCQGRIVSKKDPLCRSVEWPDRFVGSATFGMESCGSRIVGNAVCGILLEWCKGCARGGNVGKS